MVGPQQAAQNWSQGMQAAGPKFQASVNAVQVSPGQLAAAAADTWQARVTSPIAKQKFINKTGALSLQDWKNAMLQKGMSRMAAGAQVAQNKVANFMSQFLPKLASVTAQVKTMPNTTLEDRIQRMIAQVRGVQALGGTFQ